MTLHWRHSTTGYTTSHYVSGWHSLPAEDDLEDGVRARRVVVGGRDARRADGVSVLDQPHHVRSAVNHFLLETDDLHLLLAILQHSQLLLPVQQVKHLHASSNTAVNQNRQQRNEINTITSSSSGIVASCGPAATENKQETRTNRSAFSFPH